VSILLFASDAYLVGLGAVVAEIVCHAFDLVHVTRWSCSHATYSRRIMTTVAPEGDSLVMVIPAQAKRDGLAAAWPARPVRRW
jgi:hypothetical protein